MDDGESDIMNCGYGQGYSVLNVLETASALAGRPLSYTLGPRRAGDPAEVIADAKRIRGRLAWRPRHADLELILRTAIAWERSLQVEAA
jgi:UDP-glucose 4-epimerase